MRKSVNEKLNIGFIGAGGRGKELLPQFKKLSDVRIAALCDVDEERFDETAKKYPGAKKYGDLRKLYDDKDIDAVVIATCNHWHVLAAIWAMQAGKDVYVEKPLSHNHWEGQQLVAAARQARSHRADRHAAAIRSDAGGAQAISARRQKARRDQVRTGVPVRAARNRSASDRRRSNVPKTVNYDLWLGPAQNQPIYRDKLHYDWHWNWNTGNGEMGNWGVHVLDDAVNVVLRDQVPFPKRVTAAGGRFVWNDAGETPNVCLRLLRHGLDSDLVWLEQSARTARETRRASRSTTWAQATSSIAKAATTPAAAARARRTTSNGKEIRKFKGDSGPSHQRNFVDAVKAHDRKMLNAEVQIGHQSTAWCNLADVACRAGKHYSHEQGGCRSQGFRALGSTGRSDRSTPQDETTSISRNRSSSSARRWNSMRARRSSSATAPRTPTSICSASIASKFEVPAIA